eukprot:gene14695-16221_t
MFHCFSLLNEENSTKVTFRSKTENMTKFGRLLVKNAWADTKFSVQWAQRTLKAALESLDEFILFCDNLAGKIAPEYVGEVRRLGGIVWCGPAGATYVWRPLDAGYEKLIKSLVQSAQDE